MKYIYIILFLIFGALVLFNFRFLNIHMLSIYSIDEYAYHGSLINMYDGLINFDLRKFFSFGFYSYGFIFFLFNLILTAPFIYSDNIEMVIYLPRILNSLFAVGSLLIIYKICKIYIKESSSILIVIFTITMPGFWKNSLWFHPDWMMTFFVIYSIYYFILDSWSFKKYFWYSSILFGFGLSTKIQAITFLPFVLTFIFYENIQNLNFTGLLKKVKLSFNYLLLSFTVFIITNPYLFHPKGFKAFISAFSINMNSNTTNHGSNKSLSILDKIANSIDFYYLDNILFLFFLLYSIIIIYSFFKKRNEKSIHSVIAIYVIVHLGYLLFIVNKDWQHYYLTLFAIGTLLLISISIRIKKYNQYLLIVLIVFQITTHIDELKSTFTDGFQDLPEMSKTQKDDISNSLINDLKNLVNENSNILISPYQPIEFDRINLDYKNIHILYEPISIDRFQLEAYLKKSIAKDPLKFKKIDFIIISKNDVYFNNQNNNKLKKSLNIIQNFNNAGNLGYENFKENKYFYIWKKIK